jgi:hypothetical protein
VNALCWIRVCLATLVFHIPERLAGHWHSAPAGVNRHDSVLLWDRTFKGHVAICINSSARVRSSWYYGSEPVLNALAARNAEPTRSSILVELLGWYGVPRR